MVGIMEPLVVDLTDVDQRILRVRVSQCPGDDSQIDVLAIGRARPGMTGCPVLWRQ